MWIVVDSALYFFKNSVCFEMVGCLGAKKICATFKWKLRMITYKEIEYFYGQKHLTMVWEKGPN